MAKQETPNLVMLRDVARRIEPLLPRLAFLGGVVVELETGDVPALLEGHLAPDEASQSRAGLVLSRIETISRLG